MMDEEHITLVKVPRFYGHEFWNEVFEAAKESGAQVIVVNGPVKIYRAEGGGATINIIDRLFGWRGSGK